ncbi:MAG: GntR family transcriptional regulator [Sphaerochaetaceae bacterium]|nr:GntR family transcriptional regulator [Sphaerochaetaceae bacterium]MDC7236249.1 GntR family transcriptional regulator [Sphaerochaetaceae bacterium]MDC7248748.1 GntR family transcriptional regulator [Sphaerochaetaceae bacterium]
MLNDNSIIIFDDLGTKAYKKLKEMIISGQLKPGQKLNQVKLAEKLGISRTPLLQAMNRLTSEQLTETIPRRGTRVRKFTNEDLLSIFEIRGRLEPYICELAARSINEEQILLLQENIAEMSKAIENNDEAIFKTLDNEFHSIIIEGSNNSFIAEVLQKYVPLMHAVNLLKPMEKSLQDHKNIVESLIEKDGLGASQLMHYHIYGSTKNKLLQILSQRG